MEFKYSCIGDNSQENREWLEKVGYKFNFVVSYVEFEIIYTWKGEMFFIDKIDVKNLEPSLFINCIGNPQLFQAVSAIRDGTDIMQYFTNGVHWYLCESVRFANSELMEIDRGGSDYWKATLAELQEKFKPEHL